MAEEGDGSPHHLKWVLSPHESPAAGAYVPFILEGERQRLAEQGGAGAEAGVGDGGDEESATLREKIKAETRADGKPLYTPLMGLSLLVFFALHASIFKNCDDRSI